MSGVDRWQRVIDGAYLQIFRISFGLRVRYGELGEGVWGERAKLGAEVGPAGGLIRLLSAMIITLADMTFVSLDISNQLGCESRKEGAQYNICTT